MGLISKVFRGIGSTIDDMMSGAGNVGASVSYLTGRTGRLLQEGAEESIRRNGRILNRQQQARGVFNRTTLKGQIVQERLAMQGPAPLTSVKDAVNTLASQDRRYATNTTKYEKALASRARAKSFLGYRAAPAAALIGGGYIGGAMMRNVVEQRKAYYGEEMYASRYGEGGERAASLIETAGLVVGGSALLGMDPVSGTAKLAKRLSKKSRHQAIRSRILEREANRRTLEKVGPVASVEERVRRNSRVTPGMRKSMEAPVTRRQRRIARQLRDETLGRADQVVPMGTTGRYSSGQRTIPGAKPRRGYRDMPEDRRVNAANQLEGRYMQASSRRNAEVNFRRQIESEAKKQFRREQKTFNKTLRKERKLLEKELGQKNMPLTPEMKNLRERVGRQNKLIKQNSRLAGLYSGPLVAAGAVGLGTAAVLAPDPMITIGTSVALGAAMAPRAVGFALRHKAALGVAGATVATGAAIGMNMPQYAAAEGNIQEVNYARQSATQKLNYSTAGLVQAIHNNRRM